MLKSRFNVRAASSLALLLTLAFMIACHGFFTDPVLQSITVTPASPSIAVGSTQQMSASGVNDDGSTKTLSNVTWSSSNTANATISTSGLLTGVAAGTSTITATSGAISGTTTATVLAAALQSITISGNTTVAPGGTVTFTAIGHLADGSTPTLTSVQWTSSNTAVATIDPSSGVATAVAGAQSGQQTIITATSGTVSATVTLTIGLGI